LSIERAAGILWTLQGVTASAVCVVEAVAVN
jgi:hypothetical protein